jgi:pyruvate dehydrogenase kinase 2/3/4
VGHLNASFPYILSHLEYIIGELLRNSIQAIVEQQGKRKGLSTPPPIEVTVCEAAQHVIIRISDQGGGIPSEMLPYLWAFSKGPRSTQRLENLHQVPKMAATLQEVRVRQKDSTHGGTSTPQSGHNSSLSSFTSRPPDLRLGMGLPLSRVYAEYWAGSLELHSLEGYGVDAFLQISKLGNKNEQVNTRASMDAV